MATLMEQLRVDQLAARKTKKNEPAAILTTLIGEAAMVGKNDGNRETTDEEVVAVIKKFIKGSTEVMERTATDSVAHKVAEFEVNFLAMYLPRQMSDEVLRIKITEIGDELGLSSPKDMGTMMKALKERYAGSYDGKAASTLVRDYLNG